MHTAYLDLTERVVATLRDQLPENMLYLPIHDDLSEKNILIDGGRIRLLCDWDSYRAKLFWEHVACTSVRFCTDRPLQGVLKQDKLTRFITRLDPEVLASVPDTQLFAGLFPILATLKHLRTYRFRVTRVSDQRSELNQSLLEWPLEHCTWLLTNCDRVSSWIEEIFANKTPR
ncbi:MAG: hypothetical protein O3A63_13350 [Proteobacteria bacterium]|nr:hypothetical protein [Pseudomonadota bacterium]